MKKMIAIAAAAAVLTACGGGGGDSTVPAKPAEPACTARVVSVALVGDSTMYAIDGAADATLPWPQIRTKHSPDVELQTLMDARFGKGMVTITNYAVPGSFAEMAPKVTADIVVVNYGINDMNGGFPLKVYADYIRGTGATIVQTQYPTTYADARELGYVETMRGLGIPVADAYAYIRSLPNWQSYYPNPLSAHVTDELTKKVVDNVLAPLVTQQVEAKRCAK